LTFNLLS